MAVILRELDQQLQVLLIRRAEHPDDPWSGHMALPGGRVEPDDRDARAAVDRETLEEVAIDLSRHGRPLGRLDDLQARGGGRWLDLAITPFVFELIGEVSPRPNEEVEEIHWIPIRALLDPAVRSTLPYVLDGMRVQLPCLRINDRVIWGLTYRMLQGLFQLVQWNDR